MLIAKQSTNPFKSALDQIGAMYLPHPQQASLPEKNLAVYLNNKYRISCLWIAYERLGMGQLNRYPLNINAFRKMRPFANLMLARLDLCKGVHEFAPGLYPFSYLEHWTQLELESKEIYIEMAVGQKEEPEVAKTDWLKMMRQFHKKLENRCNPFDEQLPTYFNLIEVARKLAESKEAKNGKRFELDYWLPFVRAFQQYYLHVQREGTGALFCSGNQLLQTTQGKPKAMKLPQSSKDVKHPMLAKYYCLS